MSKKDDYPENLDIYRTAIRVSAVAGRDKDSFQGTFRSPDDQLRQGKRFAETQGGIHDDVSSWNKRELNVSGFSKKYTERKNIQEHLADAREGKFQHIIFTYTDRSSRGVADGINLYDAFREAGVQVHYLDNPGSPETDETFETRRDFNLIVSAELSRRARRRSLNNIKTRTAEGLPHGAAPGWIRRDLSKKSNDLTRYSIDETAAIAYRRLIELRLQFKGQFAIAKTLNDEKLLTSAGKEWTQSRVQRVLSEYFLRRMEGYSSVGTGRYSQHMQMSKVTWIPKPVFPALITQEVADELRRVSVILRDASPELQETGKQGERGLSADDGVMLSGKLKCSICGKNMASATGFYANWTDKSQGYRRAYRCVNGGTSANHASGSLKVDADSVEDAVARVLRFVLGKPLATAKKAPARRAAKPEVTTEQVDAELERLKQLHIRGWIDLDEFEEKATPLRDKREALLMQRGEADEPILHAAALASFAGMPEIIEPEAIRAAWRRLVLIAVDSVTIPVDLPENAPSLIDAGAAGRRITSSDLRVSKKSRRYILVKLRWNVQGYGNLFYAPCYRRTYTETRMLFGDPAMTAI